MAAIGNVTGTGCLMGQPACNASGLIPVFGELDEPFFALYSELPPACGASSPAPQSSVTRSGGGSVPFTPAVAFSGKRGCCH